MNAHLYHIVDASSTEELHPIVDALEKSQFSMLKISRVYERFSPRHAHYKDAIADDVYRLAITSMARTDGKRPGYQDMISALCKQIGVTGTQGDVRANEALLLNTFASQHLSSVSPAKRQTLVNEACTAAAQEAAGLLSSDAWSPFAAGLLHMAYLRRKLVAEGRLGDDFPRKLGESTAIVPVPAAAPANNDKFLVVGAEDGEAVLSLMRLTDIDVLVWPLPDTSRKAIHAMTPVLKALEPFLSAEQMLKGEHYVRALLPPGATLSVGKDGFKVGVAKGQQGLVNFAAVSATGVAAPAALLTLAVAVAEQKKWEDIERSLDQIKDSLKDVSRFQREERRAVLTGSIKYFRQVAYSVLTGEQASEVLHEIERHEAELVRVQEHLTSEIRAQIDAVSAIKKEGWGSGKYVKALQDAQALLLRSYEEVLLCVRARACGYQLLCAYPGRDAGKRARMEDISGALGQFGPSGEVTIAMDRALRKKIQSLPFDGKAHVLALENLLFDQIDAQSSAIQSATQDVSRELAGQAAPLAIDLKLKNGEVVAARAC